MQHCLCFTLFFNRVFSLNLASFSPKPFGHVYLQITNHIKFWVEHKHNLCKFQIPTTFLKTRMSYLPYPRQCHPGVVFFKMGLGSTIGLSSLDISSLRVESWEIYVEREKKTDYFLFNYIFVKYILVFKAKPWSILLDNFYLCMFNFPKILRSKYKSIRHPWHHCSRHTY